MAALRERYGFTANESLDMGVIEFEAWLEALLDDDSGKSASEVCDEDEVWEAIGGK